APPVYEASDNGRAGTKRQECRSGRPVRGPPEERHEDARAARVLIDEQRHDAPAPKRVAERVPEARILAEEGLDARADPEASDQMMEALLVHAPGNHREGIAAMRDRRREDLPVADVAGPGDAALPRTEGGVQRGRAFDHHVFGPLGEPWPQGELGEGFAGVAERRPGESPAPAGV